MEGTSPDPTCLFVGARGVGKSTLLRALQLSPTSTPPVAANHTLRLDTKYYTADVAVRALSTQQQDEQQLHADAWEQVQALVLIFDASDDASFTSVRSWADARDTDSIEVKLLVANKADTLQQQSTTADTAAAASCRTQWLQEAMSWCFDAGYEYVEAAAGRPAVDAALQLDGERQGVARVLAALQAHMWPGMVQKDWQPQTLPDLRGPSAAAAAINAGVGSSSSSSSRDQGSPAADAAAPAAAADALASSNAGAVDTARAADATMALPAEQQQQQQQQQQQVDQQPNSTALLRQSSGAKSSTPAPQQQQQQQQQGRQQQQRSAAPADDDDEDDCGLDDFEQLMKQLQGMRTRLSHLPDDERRTAAADMAVKLASMWGLADEEASSEEGDAAAARADGQQQLDVRK